LDRTVKVWDLGKGTCRSTLSGHTSDVWALAISADGRRIVSGSDDRTIRLWDGETGRCEAVLEGHAGKVRGLAVPGDEGTVVSGAEDGAIRTWDLGTLRCRSILNEHSQKIRSLAVDRDGSHAFTAAWSIRRLRSLFSISATVLKLRTAIDDNCRVVSGEESGAGLRCPKHGLDYEAIVDPLPMGSKPDGELADELLVLRLQIEVDLSAADTPDRTITLPFRG
jgi:WD40 repeat protein